MTGKLHLPVPAMIAAGPVYRGGGLFMAILFLGTIWWPVRPGARTSVMSAPGTTPSRACGRRPRCRPATRRSGGLDFRWVDALRDRRAARSGCVSWEFPDPWPRGSARPSVWSASDSWPGLHAARAAWCTAPTYCPIGALAVTLGKISPFRLRIQQSCKGCSLCTPVCRYGALRPEDLERGTPGPNCTLCGDCLATCRRGFLEHRFPGTLAAQRAAALRGGGSGAHGGDARRGADLRRGAVLRRPLILSRRAAPYFVVRDISRASRCAVLPRRVAPARGRSACRMRAVHAALFCASRDGPVMVRAALNRAAQEPRARGHLFLGRTAQRGASSRSPRATPHGQPGRRRKCRFPARGVDAARARSAGTTEGRRAKRSRARPRLHAFRRPSVPAKGTDRRPRPADDTA